MPYRHGVSVSEKNTGLNTPVKGTAGLQVIFGTAPCNLAEDPSTAANVPKLCYTFAEAKKAVGYCEDFDNYSLCQAISATFKVFNVAPVVLVNVLDPTKTEHKTAVEKAQKTLTGGKVKLEAFGVILSTLSVSETSSGTDLTPGTDYKAEFDDEGYCVITTLGTQTSLYIGYSKLNPSGVTASDIIGGTTGSTEKGLDLIRQIYPRFGLTAGIISAPGWSHNATVCAAMQAKCEGINGVFAADCVVDIPSNVAGAQIYSSVNTAKATVGATSKHTTACWPKAKIGTQIYYLSALISALMSYVTASDDDIPYRSPSNQPIGITGLCLDDSANTEVILDQEQANTVNSYGVVTCLNFNGFRCWGNNTAAYPASVDPKDRWIACRRMFTWWGNSLILNYHRKVDNPGNTRLIENVVDDENIRGNGFVAKGYLAGARVEYLSSENTREDILAGKITFNIHIAPFIPSEDIEFVLEFDADALVSSLGGEN